MVEGLVVEGLEAIAGQLPFPVLGTDSDNDSVFINQTLIKYCADRGIEFTRSRAYRKNDQAKNDQAKNDQAKNDLAKNDQAKNDQAKNDQAKNDQAKNDQAKNDQAKNDQAKNDQAKNDQAKNDQAKNDQAWIEQKNGSVVRRFAGYDRYSGRIAGQTMVHRYKAVRLHVNYFQPSFKLLEKFRDGARVIKRYSPPATPCDRLMQHDETSVVVKNELREYRAGLDPVTLLRSIREAQSAMAAMSSPQPQGLLLVRALTGSWPPCPTCGNRGEPGPPTGTKCARLATGVPGRIPSKAFGATCFCGFKKTPTPTPRICWQNYARPIRAGSKMLNCERCSAG